MSLSGARVANVAAVAAAVSLALAMGGVTGCSQADRGPANSGVTVDQPAEPDTGSRSTGQEPGPESSEEVPGGEPEPAPEGAGAQDPEIGGSDDTAAPAATTPAEQFSTGPVLQWTEIHPGFDDLFSLGSVGDGRVIARVWTEEDRQGLFGERFVRSSDGVEWTELTLPEGLFPERVSIAADRWVVTGQYLDVDRPEAWIDRVFFSDDQGFTWTEMVIDLPSDPASPYAVEGWSVSEVLVAGERMVLTLAGYTTIDGQALLEDTGRLPAGKRVVFTVPTPGGLSFTLIDSSAPNAYASFASTAFRLASAYGHFNAMEAPELAYDELTLTYEGIGVTEAEAFELSALPEDPLSRIVVSDGTAGRVVREHVGWIFPGAATDDGFVLMAVGTTGETVLTSPDGFVWSEGPSSGSGFPGAVLADGTTWRVASETGGSFDIQRAGFDETPVTVATFDGLEHPGPLLLGPAGMVLVAQRDPGWSLRPDPGLTEGGRVARDGYELRYNATDSSLTLWDLAEDTAIYVFGPEEMQSDTPPEGVRVIDDGRGAGVAFEDPETGADLVMFTTEDMAFLVGMAAGELEAASGEESEWPELWVGWSADGADWGWESLADAFGIHDANIWAEFAVGRDFVIARVAAFQPSDRADPADNGQVLPTRWFLARVP